MSNLVLGCALTGANALIDDAAPVEITASVTPAMAPLHDGQAIQDVAGYAVMTDTANFSSPVGPITSAVVTATGDAASASAPLAEGAAAGFTVTVTDTLGNEQMFDAGTVTVEYRTRIAPTPENEAEIVVNPLVDDSTVLSLDISTGPYAGTYSVTAGELRNGPHFIVGPSTSGAPGVGNTLSGDRGLVTTATGVLSLADQWTADGIDIPGATGPDLVLATEQAGTQVAFEVTADDGVTTTTAQSPLVDIPAPPALTVTTVRDGFSTSLISETLSDTIPTGAAAAGKEVWLVVGFGQTGSAVAPTVTIGGVTPETVVFEAANAAHSVAIFKTDASAGGDLALTLNVASGWRGAAWRAYTVVGRATQTVVSASNTTMSTLDLSATVSPGQEIIGGAYMYGNQGLTPVGLTQSAGQETWTSGPRVAFFHEASITDIESPRIMTLDPVQTSSAAVTGAIAILG